MVIHSTHQELISIIQIYTPQPVKYCEFAFKVFRQLPDHEIFQFMTLADRELSERLAKKVNDIQNLVSIKGIEKTAAGFTGIF